MHTVLGGGSAHLSVALSGRPVALNNRTIHALPSRLGLKEVAMPAVAAYISGGATIVPSLVRSTIGLVEGIKNGITSQSDESSGDKPYDTEGVNWEELIKSDKTPASPLDVRSFRDRFAKMLDESDIQCLVIMVDDLDRCSPERIIENLEAIKLFLNVDNTAFVIGADPRIVRHAIAVKYTPDQMRGQEEEGEAPDSLVTDYLEKLIQVPYRLPRLSPAEVETYMTLLFCQRELTQDLFNQCVSRCEETREKNRYSVFGYADVEKAIGTENMKANLAQSLIFCSHVSPLITEGLKGNPRQIKRFLNAFVLRKELARVAKLSNIRDDVLVKLMVLEYAHLKEFFELFAWQQSHDGFPKRIEEWESIIKDAEGDIDKIESGKISEPRWDTKSMRRWLAMEPSLSDIDLRDYFWIARDRLESTLSGTALIPPIVRLAVSDIISDNSAKMSQAVQTVEGFEEDETISFLDLLENHVKRHVNEKPGYDAFRELINANIPGSVESYSNVLLKIPIITIPPAVGYDLLGLLKARPDLESIFEPVIERLTSKKSKISMALQLTKKKG